MGKIKQKLSIGTWITVLSLICLTTATYAWMSIASTIRLSDLELNVITDSAMELALDVDGEPGEWTTVLSLGELIDPDTALMPVTWSAAEDAFLVPRYGEDGRLGNFETLNLSQFTSGIRIPSSAEAETEEGAGYLIALDLWLRTGVAQSTVYLSEPAERTADVMGAGTWVIGEPVWDADAVQHTNGGNGAESVIRIGFRSYDESYDTGGFVIYEPNAADGETPTNGVDGGPLQGSGKLIRQARSAFTEQTPVLRGSVNYEMGQFLTEDTNLFQLENETPRKITLYIWLEGQDNGCDNSISQGKLVANIQFGASMGGDHENIYRPDGG